MDYGQACRQTLIDRITERLPARDPSGAPAKGDCCHRRRGDKNQRNRFDRSRNYPTFEQKESEAALYPHREFGFRKILQARPGVFRKISKVPDGHSPAHQGAAFERAGPEKDPVGRHHLRWRWKHAANDARLASSGRR